MREFGGEYGELFSYVDFEKWVPAKRFRPCSRKNRHRLREADIARKFLVDIMEHSELRALLLDDALLDRRGADCGLGLNERASQRTAPVIHLAWAAMASAILMARGPPTPRMPRVWIRGAAHQRGRGTDASSGLSVENRSRLIAAAALPSARRPKR